MSCPSARKKLIEVSIPLEEINRESAREKNIRYGHPSTLHLWWARRPLAACRAVLFAQLVDDPSSCPDEFPTKAEQDLERTRLHTLIKRMVPWAASTNETILNEARYEIARSVARAHGVKLPPVEQIRPKDVIKYLHEHAPPVYDPFSGGGSIPLEAQRLGLRAIGSDLNPVAVLIGKALVEVPSRFANCKAVNPCANELGQWEGASGLADDVRYYGSWMRQEAEKKIGHLYPKVKLQGGKQATVIAWLWARTVPSPDPRAKGTHVPLASSFVLSAKSGKEVIVKPLVDRARMAWRFAIDDKPRKADIELAKKGTKAARGANFVCLLTGAAIDEGHVKSQAKSGRMGTALMAIVADGHRSRIYLPPAPEHVKAAIVDTPDVPEIDQPLPKDPRNFWTVPYGLDTFASLFTPRQLVTLTTFSDLVKSAREKALSDAQERWPTPNTLRDTRRLAHGGLGPVAYADAVATYLGETASKLSVFLTTQARWRAGDGKSAPGFGRQALPMVWDFADLNPFAGAGGDWSEMISACGRVLESLPSTSGVIYHYAAQENDYPNPIIINTDPPYYDNIGYADLSDYFYVWLRRTLRDVHAELFRRVLTPKSDELVASPYRHGDKDRAERFFMTGMSKALAATAQVTHVAPTIIYYAFKQSETGGGGVTSAGWASFLQAVNDAGLAVDGTWPVRTEGATRLTAADTNALASSIVLVCRHRNGSAPTVTRADFLRTLRREMPAALTEIDRAGVGPTDIQQAAIGPGIGIFTRYAQVLNTDGAPMLVRDALKLINQVREEITSHSDADYDGETRFALDWFAAHGFATGKSGDAIKMTNALNLSLDGIKAIGFFVAPGTVARLLKRDELVNLSSNMAGGKDLGGERIRTVWEACQRLIVALTSEDGGVEEAARLYKELGARAEAAHALARRLYDICEQKNWATEARFYNELHQEWHTIERRAATLSQTTRRRDLSTTKR